MKTLNNFSLYTVYLENRYNRKNISQIVYIATKSLEILTKYLFEHYPESKYKITEIYLSNDDKDKKVVIIPEEL